MNHIVIIGFMGSGHELERGWRRTWDFRLLTWTD